MKAKIIPGSVRQCPACGNARSEVYDSRDERGRLLRRRRCHHCLKRWNTVEMPEAAWKAISEASARLGAAWVAVDSARRIVQALERPAGEESERDE